MRATIAVLFLLCACTRPAPNTCCVTPEQCEAFGVDDIRPCAAGQACAPNFTCVAKECDSSSECTSPERPICSLGLCVATCRVDGDCADVAGKPFCAADGACVGCETSDQCPAEAAFCDAEDRTCRGCERDDECASGVCLEADGTCADEADVLFVRDSGQDVGNCPRNAPCETIDYAIVQTAGSRIVIHVDGGTTSLGASPLVLDRALYIDGTDTLVISPGSTLVVDANKSTGGLNTISGLRIQPTGGSAVSVRNGARLRLFDVDVSRAIDATQGVLEVSRSRLSNVSLNCTNGQLTFQDTAHTGGDFFTSCQSSVLRNRFDEVRIGASGGPFVFENNLIVTADGLKDVASVGGAAPGSTIRFNTWVNTTSVPSDGVALDCDASVDVTSNVFAYSSMHPFGNSTCSATFSLFDAIAIAAQTAGEGNTVSDAAAIFLDRAAADYHLAAQSAARESAEPGLPVVEDIDHNPRPSPFGSVPDMGAFEAP